MSFGYGVGDCIVVGKLAWKVYEDFRQAPEIFHNLHLEVLALHTVLEKVKQTLNNAILPPEFQSDLKIIINCCDSVLQSLNELAVKYKKVGEKTRSPFDRIRLSNEDIAGSRQRLIASITMLTMFIMLVDRRMALLNLLLISSAQDLPNSFPARANQTYRRESTWKKRLYCLYPNCG